MEPLRTEIVFEAAVVACAAASAPLAEVAAMRKSAPRFAGVDVPGHFLKHVDEQTVVALDAMRLALERSSLNPRDHAAWAIVSSPRFIGRLAAGSIVHRFGRTGGTGVPTHSAAQYSLNSIAGAASIVLGTHGPNIGVGGGPGAVGDGIVAALTLYDPAFTPGVWLLLTQWDPEPIPDDGGQSTVETTCHAVALALTAEAGHDSGLRLTMPARRTHAATGKPIDRIALSPHGNHSFPEPTVAEIAAQLEKNRGGARADWSCRLPSGASVELHLAAAAQYLRIAA